LNLTTITSPNGSPATPEYRNWLDELIKHDHCVTTWDLYWTVGIGNPLVISCTET